MGHSSIFANAAIGCKEVVDGTFPHRAHRPCRCQTTGAPAAAITSIGFPNTLPPKSSTAILTAVTAPSPDSWENWPYMSVITPIYTTSSEIAAVWAPASPPTNAETATAAIATAPIGTFSNLTFMTHLAV